MRGVTEWRGGRGYISIEAIIQVMLTGSQSEGVAQRTGFLLSSSSLLLPFRRHRRPMDGLAEEPLGVINEMRGLILRERERGRGRESPSADSFGGIHSIHHLMIPSGCAVPYIWQAGNLLHELGSLFSTFH